MILNAFWYDCLKASTVGPATAALSIPYALCRNFEPTSFTYSGLRNALLRIRFCVPPSEIHSRVSVAPSCGNATRNKESGLSARAALTSAR